MTDVKSFNCPNCGSPLVPNGEAKDVKCAFCGSTVIVPQELSAEDLQADLKEKQAWDSGQDPFSPRHL